MSGVLVTGAGKRIGKAIAQRCGAAGMAVAVHYNASKDAAEETAEAICEAGGQAATVQANLAELDSLDTLVADAVAALGQPLTALVNNASVFEEDDWDSAASDLWATHMRVNLEAPYRLSRAFAKQIDPSGDGAIINIIDQRVWRLNPTFFSYTLSKSALWTMTQTLAQALAPNVRVNGVGPGPVLQSIHQDGEDFASEADATPLGQSVDPNEIAEACAFLLNARKVTGQMIAVDSGQHLAWKTPDMIHALK